MDKVWKAIYVNSRAEKKISEVLQEKHIEAYVPLVKTMRQWSDRKKMVELPLMNGYVFVRIAANEQDKVMQTKGVVNFVRSEGKIAIVRDLEIERLKQLVELGYQLDAEAINRTYKEGDKVKITSGALKGIEGYVVETKENRQIEVLLESIGQCIRVKLPKEILLSI
ncbi:MAG: UpxY family transcription antiterminator [Bacteroidia bacterium]|nr:UpxY family transcription antiterminator [Bacteroidia bacterium]